MKRGKELWSRHGTGHTREGEHKTTDLRLFGHDARINDMGRNDWVDPVDSNEERVALCYVMSCMHHPWEGAIRVPQKQRTQIWELGM